MSASDKRIGAIIGVATLLIISFIIIYNEEISAVLPRSWIGNPIYDQRYPESPRRIMHRVLQLDSLMNEEQLQDMFYEGWSLISITETDEAYNFYFVWRYK